MLAIQELQKIAQELRVTVVRMNYQAGSGHTGGSLSCAEILTVLYEVVMNIKPEEPEWSVRDRFILSKGHAAPALYATLARKGYFDKKLLFTLRKLSSPLQGHPSMKTLPGIEMSTGSLGMGISVGVGMALAAKIQRKSHRIFVLCGDGELQEGQNWEAFMSAAKWNLNNLYVVVDRNHVQLDGANQEIMPLGDLVGKIDAFGVLPITCDGHNIDSLLEAFTTAGMQNRPTAIVAETVKGKGVSFMEGKNIWHGKPINDEELRQALRELEEQIDK